jgi:transposase
LKWAQILLAANDGVSDQEIERTIGASGSTIYRTKRRLVECNRYEDRTPGRGRRRGVDGALSRIDDGSARCRRAARGAAAWRSRTSFASG